MMNISRLVPDLADGDRVVVNGNDQSWTGTYAGRFNGPLKRGASHWRGAEWVIINQNEPEVDGLHHRGQSGSMGLGKCGSIGTTNGNGNGHLFVDQSDFPVI